MAEGQITIDAETHRLARPFMVFATQNPIECEGTFPLPEAQLDRFNMRLKMGYPDESTEIAMLERLRLRHPVDSLTAVVGKEDIVRAQEMVKNIYVASEVRWYAVKIVRATRSHPDLAVGASPRASLALFRAAQAFAAVKGLEFVLPDFIKLQAPYILEHRLMLKPEARLKRKQVSEIVWGILEQIPAPNVKE